MHEHDGVRRLRVASGDLDDVQQGLGVEAEGQGAAQVPVEIRVADRSRDVHEGFQNAPRAGVHARGLRLDLGHQSVDRTDAALVDEFGGALVGDVAVARTEGDGLEDGFVRVRQSVHRGQPSVRHAAQRRHDFRHRQFPHGRRPRRVGLFGERDVDRRIVEELETLQKMRRVGPHVFFCGRLLLQVPVRRDQNAHHGDAVHADLVQVAALDGHVRRREDAQQAPQEAARSHVGRGELQPIQSGKRADVVHRRIGLLHVDANVLAVTDGELVQVTLAPQARRRDLAEVRGSALIQKRFDALRRVLVVS
mmetsp:Transcript_4699/g.14671  ORF Transcript_4699/g.14671 Transcript_4699/m.14671 type:complete len:307 (+) Transcript_4699:3181-4101(+)